MVPLPIFPNGGLLVKHYNSLFSLVSLLLFIWLVDEEVKHAASRNPCGELRFPVVNQTGVHVNGALQVSDPERKGSSSSC